MAQPVQPPSVRSVGSDLNQYMEGLAQKPLVEQTLAAYEVESTTDRTPSILTAFANELFQDGASTSQKDILECPDDGTLHQKRGPRLQVRSSCECEDDDIFEMLVT